ncbi:terminase large subunit [Weissella diestrammenae]|uniref:Terminase large subunit n=1 Tax=Weissella diestrammenae TaxID=1162633 RepID=A0A7G9T4Q2_9LACO|nr:terminase TerL endonuclease subunit [Weissella diestrammenae]MCM0582785.1 terminase large subunit [Weissella diestrammenae]QNN75077.1 terminase large subunit [Weissella diestrammenae]
MRYFDKYVELIEKGDIVVGRAVKLAIKRVERFKEQYKFKQNEVDRRIKFIENETSQTKGGNGKLKLALPQKVWLEVAWGFYHDAEVTKVNPETMEEYQTVEERRLIHEIPVIMARGSGKTTLGSAIAMVGQIMDGEYGADVQLLAYNREQAGFLYNASRAMTSNENSLLHMMVLSGSLRSTKQGILYEPTNSLMNIKTSDYESLDGTNAHFNIFDEVHTYDDDFIKVVNDGSAKKRKNWQTWYLSTNGTKRERLFDRYFKIWMDILEGKTDNDSVMPFIYQLDNPEEIHDSKMWQKSMPLLGITTEKETIAADIEMSRNDPSQQAELMAKTFNLPVNNYLAYFVNEETKGNRDKFKPELFDGEDGSPALAIIGIDLSAVNDISSVSFMIKDGDAFQFVNRKYMPRTNVEKLPKEQRDKYFEWEQQGYLILHEEAFNKQSFIFDDIQRYMSEHNILPMAVGYDDWNAAELHGMFNDSYGEITHNVSMTTKTLSQPMKIYKQLIGNEKIVFDDPVATWNHLNVVVRVDGAGNIFPNKEKAKNKIDVFMSQLIAFITYEKNKDDLEYYYS